MIVTSNLYGDIISDIAAEVAGSVGLGASANIGPNIGMFEAIHGSAPDIAGLGIANPSGLLLSGVSMLVHLGQTDIASRIHNAWLATLEDGLHTADIYVPGRSKARLGTEAFADAIIERLDQKPRSLKPVAYRKTAQSISQRPATNRPRSDKTLVGIDIFVDAVTSPETLARDLTQAVGTLVPLQMISNRGVKVWPNGHDATFCTDHWRCRFQPERGKQFNRAMAIELQRRLNAAAIDFIKSEHLFDFDGVPGYSLGQGQ